MCLSQDLLVFSLFSFAPSRGTIFTAMTAMVSPRTQGIFLKAFTFSLCFCVFVGHMNIIFLSALRVLWGKFFFAPMRDNLYFYSKITIMKKITIYCGSNKGKNPIYEEGAKALANEMVKRNMALVYGAGNVGLMGVIADAMLEAGMDVYGIIPQKLVDIEVAHRGLTELTVVETMRDRKWLMAEKGDGFIAMPGGIGTFEELFEIMTLNQLAYISKPLALYNVHGYYDGLITFLQHSSKEGFLHQAQLDLLIVSSDPVELLEKMSSFEPKYIEKWEVK